MTTDREALSIALRALPNESRAALHLALAVGRTETHYGDNWDHAGAGSNNWGSVQGTPGFEHLDHHANGEPYTTSFKTYPSPLAGFKDLAFEVLRRPGAREAAERGDGTAAVFAMHDGGYFELDPAKYAASLEKQYAGFLAGTGEPRLLTFSGPAPGVTPPAEGSGSSLDALTVLGLALAGAWLKDMLTPTKGPRL